MPKSVSVASYLDFDPNIAYDLMTEKCEFCQIWYFKNVIFVKIEVFKMWILWQKCGFLPQCVSLSLNYNVNCEMNSFVWRALNKIKKFWILRDVCLGLVCPSSFY